MFRACCIYMSMYGYGTRGTSRLGLWTLFCSCHWHSCSIAHGSKSASCLTDHVTTNPLGNRMEAESYSASLVWFSRHFNPLVVLTEVKTDSQLDSISKIPTTHCLLNLPHLQTDRSNNGPFFCSCCSSCCSYWLITKDKLYSTNKVMSRAQH